MMTQQTSYKKERQAARRKNKATIETNFAMLDKIWKVGKDGIGNATMGAAHANTTALGLLVQRFQSVEPTLETMALPPGISHAHAPAYFFASNCNLRHL